MNSRIAQPALNVYAGVRRLYEHTRAELRLALMVKRTRDDLTSKGRPLPGRCQPVATEQHIGDDASCIGARHTDP